MPISRSSIHSQAVGRHGNKPLLELIVGEIYLDLECEDVIICTQVTSLGAGVYNYRCHSVGLDRSFIYDIDDLKNILPASKLVLAVLRAQGLMY